MFKKVLVANRGVIAVRIIRTLRDLEIPSLAVYEESDYGSLHVLLSDESAQLPEAQHYTSEKQIIKIALKHGADAIHPGYGFMAESSRFAEACHAANLTFLGPPAKALAACSSKLEIMEQAEGFGMKVLPHSQKSFAPKCLAEISASAQKLGYPLHVKASAGSGMRASRLINGPAELEAGVEIASREAQITFEGEQVYLEKWLTKSRTIQLQFLIDKSGKMIVLGTVDVTMNKHNRRFLCEAPAPGIELAPELISSCEKLLKQIGYIGLGAFEFLLDQDGNYFFMELQARIQNEHSAIELLTRLDLVREQIKIIAGLPCTSEVKPTNGVTMQCRIYAEDLLRQSLPSPGVLRRFRLPGGPNVRVDAFAYGGCVIPERFDPLLSTIACWGETRHDCLVHMRRALRDTAITGVKTNQARIQVLLQEGDFADGKYNHDTMLLPHKLSFSDKFDDKLAAIAAIAFCAKIQRSGLHKPERLSGGWHASSRSFND